MYTLFVLLLVVVAVSANFQSKVDEHFSAFKTKFRRTYASADEEGRRRGIFVENMIRVDELNALNGEPVFGVTKFSDLTQEEMKNMKGLIRPDKDPEPHEIKFREGKSFGLGLPSLVNWVTAGMTTPIKNQGQCGACWVHRHIIYIFIYLYIVYIILYYVIFYICCYNPKEGVEKESFVITPTLLPQLSCPTLIVVSSLNLSFTFIYFILI